MREERISLISNYFSASLALCTFLPLVSPQSQKLSYAAAALQAGGSSHSSGQASSSSSASPQVLNITIIFLTEGQPVNSCPLNDE